MAVPFARFDGPVTAIEPGQYTTQTASGRPAISCPACGGIDEVEAAVDEGGAVAEAHRCSTATCPFLDRINLIGWAS